MVRKVGGRPITEPVEYRYWLGVQLTVFERTSFCRDCFALSSSFAAGATRGFSLALAALLKLARATAIARRLHLCGSEIPVIG